MVIHQFTEEQMEKLRLNPYTFSVTPNQIRFTKEFKEEFFRRLQDGDTSRKILRDLGYSDDLISKSRMISIYQSVKTEAASPNGFTDPNKRKTSVYNPNQGKYEGVPDNIAMQRMQKDLSLMRQELDFLKKILSFKEDSK